MLMSPIPSLDKTYSLVLQEERQKFARNIVLPNSEGSALAAYQSFFKRKEKLDLTCTHCGKSGHNKDKCYRLIGFPPNFKFIKSKFNANASGVVGNHSAHQAMSHMA